MKNICRHVSILFASLNFALFFIEKRNELLDSIDLFFLYIYLEIRLSILLLCFGSKEVTARGGASF